MYLSFESMQCSGVSVIPQIHHLWRRYLMFSYCGAYQQRQQTRRRRGRGRGLGRLGHLRTLELKLDHEPDIKHGEGADGQALPAGQVRGSQASGGLSPCKTQPECPPATPYFCL
jgi:hypothetical protein